MSVELPLLEGAVEFVVFFVVTIAYLNKFTVSRGANIRYLTSLLVPFWLKGFPAMNTVALSV
jgi:hypothetical protein